MSRYRFELATRADDAGLRRVLAATPMEGDVAVSFRREPRFFDAAMVDGPFFQVITARDDRENCVVGLATRSVRERFVNGTLQPIGYLSTLRIVANHRKRGLVPRGFAFLRTLHADGRTPLYLTTIAAGNRPALQTLTSGRAGLPRYHPLGDFHTVVLSSARVASLEDHAAELQLRPATLDDLPALVAFLQTQGGSRQFFPNYQAPDFFTPSGTFRDLEPADLILAFRKERLVGVLGSWDQHKYRQSVVEGYRGPLKWVRLVYNAWARLRRRPRLPAPGEPFDYDVAALPVVTDDDPQVFAALLRYILENSNSSDRRHLLIGLHARDPLLAVARKLQVACYTTHLYAVCWEDGESLRATLDDRVPYLELGCL